MDILIISGAENYNPEIIKNQISSALGNFILSGYTETDLKQSKKVLEKMGISITQCSDFYFTEHKETFIGGRFELYIVCPTKNETRQKIRCCLDEGLVIFFVKEKSQVTSVSIRSNHKAFPDTLHTHGKEFRRLISNIYKELHH